MVIALLRRFAIGVGIFSTVCGCFSPMVQAERVGFSYAGELLQQPPDPLHPELPAPTEFTLFGVVVSVGQTIRGTFSYDTTAAGVTASDGSRSFKQAIDAGFTFNVFNADGSPRLQVSASEYSLTAVDNYSQAGVPGMIDYLSVDFNNKTVPAPPALRVNNSAYITSSTTLLRVPLSWDYSTFNGASEPQLHPDLPDNTALFPFVGAVRAGKTASFNVTSTFPIGAIAGDYNRDGTVGNSDLTEWRRAFNKPAHTHADGNGDGIVDGADYIVWRHSQRGPSPAATIVPEPSTLTCAALLLLSLSIRRRSKSHADN